MIDGVFCRKHVLFGGMQLLIMLMWWISPHSSMQIDLGLSPKPLPNSAAHFHSEYLPVSLTPMLHAPTIARLPRGALLVVWYGGSREGARDVGLYQSRWMNNQWQRPQRLLDRQAVMTQTKRWIKRLGNPVLVNASDGSLHLFFVSSIAGWGVSSLNRSISTDEGETWQPVQRLITSPFANYSTLVRTPALSLSGGGLLLPIYHELFAKYPELLVINSQGQIQDKRRISHQNGLLQPLLLQTDHALLALSRVANSRLVHRVHVSTSRDGGAHWSDQAPLSVSNRDTSLTGLTTQIGQHRIHLMVYNWGANPRNRLSLAASADGRNWCHLSVLEHGRPKDEFSYPFMIQQGDHYHVVYTWKRQRIKHVDFNQAWLLGRIRQNRCFNV